MRLRVGSETAARGPISNDDPNDLPEPVVDQWYAYRSHRRTGTCRSMDCTIKCAVRVQGGRFREDKGDGD